MAATSKNWKSFARAREQGYRSGLEVSVCAQLAQHGVTKEAHYETHKVKYESPPKPHTYLADFWLPNGIVIETKGRFVSDDRVKHLLIKKQHPDLDLRFVFSNSRSFLRKGSATSYGMWCNKNGFMFADKLIPLDWINEPLCHTRLAALHNSII